MKSLKFITLFFRNNTDPFLPYKTGVAFAFFCHVLSLRTDECQSLHYTHSCILSFHCTQENVILSLYCTQSPDATIFTLRTVLPQFSCSRPLFDSPMGPQNHPDRRRNSLVFSQVRLGHSSKKSGSWGAFEVTLKELGTRNIQCFNSKKKFFFFGFIIRFLLSTFIQNFLFIINKL